MALNIRTEEKFSYGLVGSADIMGIVKEGWFVAIECKTGSAEQSKEQKNFQHMVHRFGGHYQVVRTPEQALEFVRGVSSCKRF